MISIEKGLKFVGSLEIKEVTAILSATGYLIKMEGKIQSNDKYLIKTKYPENYSADGVQRACIGAHQRASKNKKGRQEQPDGLNCIIA